tara:strand:+ start:94 stop:378 length:285 start_codon:yes stop_codon:yes gene_type:complete
MKTTLIKIFSPILNQFENESDEYILKPLNRKVVLAIGALMSGLSILILFLAWPDKISSYFLPPLIFGMVGITALVVGCLGSDHAVAKLIGNRKK